MSIGPTAKDALLPDMEDHPPSPVHDSSSPLTSFTTLGLSTGVAEAACACGYQEPTDIQKEAIPIVLKRQDLLGCAQTGSGKTASFILPMIDLLQSMRARARMPRSLILEPTRELALQVAENFATYSRNHRLSTAVLIGGNSTSEQERTLGAGVQLLIATPGRLLDIQARGRLLLADTQILVIDEADRMLDMGFIPDVRKILSLLPRQRQTLLFSATLPLEVRRLAEDFMNKPHTITVSPQEVAAENVDHRLVKIPNDSFAARLAAITNLVSEAEVKTGLIFCNRKRDVHQLTLALKRLKLSIAELHGDMHQQLRQSTLESFRRGQTSFLVCSDVAARGLDIRSISHVFLFDLPFNPEDYVHRIGRTGRAGDQGVAVSLVAPGNDDALTAIEGYIGRKIPYRAPAEPPSPTPAPESQAPESQAPESQAVESQAAELPHSTLATVPARQVFKPISPRGSLRKVTRNVQPASAPQVQPASVPQVQPASAPQVQPASVPQVQPASVPQVQPASAPQVQPALAPQVQPASVPQVQPASAPQVQPASVPQEGEPQPRKTPRRRERPTPRPSPRVRAVMAPKPAAQPPTPDAQPPTPDVQPPTPDVQPPTPSMPERAGSVEIRPTPIRRTRKKAPAEVPASLKAGHEPFEGHTPNFFLRRPSQASPCAGQQDHAQSLLPTEP